VGGKGIHGENSGPVMRDWEMPGEMKMTKYGGTSSVGNLGVRYHSLPTRRRKMALSISMLLYIQLFYQLRMYKRSGKNPFKELANSPHE